MLAGRGFKRVYNLSGGIKAWQNHTVCGDEFVGLGLFSGKESLRETLLVAYSMEQGLREFYLGRVEEVSDSEVEQVFTILADVEIKHQQSILSFYRQISGEPFAQSEFEERLLDISEGGLTTKQYISRFGLSSSPEEIALTAISIEAMALDLYQRAAYISSGKTKDFLLKIANEEQGHLNMLAKMVDDL